MEILSTGEKIKRARVYNGYTLKDICGDKVSVSKMSCIENDKVKAEEWILELIAKKLNLDVDYLSQGIREQLEKNVEQLNNNRNLDNFEEKVIYNLGYAESSNYTDICFQLMHILFNYYLDHNMNEKIQSINSQYYDYFQKCQKEDNELIYYMDMARFLFRTREYAQASNYYNNIRKSAKEKDDFVILAKATYNEAACHIMVENYDRAYEIAVRLEDLVQYLEGDFRKAEAYHMLAMLSISMDKGKFEMYEQKSYELYKSDIRPKATAIYNYATAMFDVGMKDKAIEYIKRALELYPDDDKEDLVEFMLLATNELYENGVLEEAQSICDNALNFAIELDDVKFIETGYYYKSIILQKQNNLFSAEMYMNLSLDALFKFGTKIQIYKRYIEMGNMYHKLGQTRDAVKYFNLAVALEKKM